MDVCLLLEGTFPYVAGGVSTWVYDLITQMPDIQFSIVYLGAHRPTIKKLHYPIPPNVVDFREIYLFDYRVDKEKKKHPSKKDFETIEKFLIAIKKNDLSLFAEVMKLCGDPFDRCINLYDLAHTYEGWKMIERLYQSESTQKSFLDYFWTWRFIYLPFFSLLRVQLPPAKLYHAVSTGYAGLVGVMGKLQHLRPFLLTEHGIYTRERKIEISQAEWIYSDTVQDIKVAEGGEFFKEWWTQMFSSLSQLAYDSADRIVTLYKGNQVIQIEEGADPQKTEIIVNGIDIKAYENKPKEAHPEILRVGFMGRVVPIKDIKTFIRACKIIHDELPHMEVLLMGPIDEDEDYYKECQVLIEALSLENVIQFKGKVQVKEYYPKLDILVLTSISEGQPIVILEAHACGIPVVATDVGGCRELLEGSDLEDQLIGPSGIVTPICRPELTAQAVLKILKNPELYESMSQAAKKRVNKYYQLDYTIASYQVLYARYMEEVRWQA